MVVMTRRERWRGRGKTLPRFALGRLYNPFQADEDKHDEEDKDEDEEEKKVAPQCTYSITIPSAIPSMPPRPVFMLRSPRVLGVLALYHLVLVFGNDGILLSSAVCKHQIHLPRIFGVGVHWNLLVLRAAGTDRFERLFHF